MNTPSSIAPSLATPGARLTIKTGTQSTFRPSRTGYGYVHIWAPRVDGLPDAFVLLGHDAGGAEVYRRRRLALDAVQAAGTIEPSEGEPHFATHALWFHYLDNDHTLSGTGGNKVLFYRDTTYTLVHQPGGSERGEYTLFTKQPWYQAFASHDGPTEVGGYSGRVSEGDRQHHRGSATLTATTFYSGDSLTELGGGRPARFTNRNRVWSMGTRPTGFDIREAIAEDDRPPPPGGPSSTPPGGAISLGRSTSPNDPTPLPPSFEGATSWLSLYARVPTARWGPVWGAVRPADPERQAWEADNESESRVLLGVWEVDRDGKYLSAAFPDAPEADATPETVGAPSPYVLVPNAFVSNTEKTVYAHSFFAKPVWARVAQATESGLSRTRDALTPIDFAKENAWEFETDAENARWDAWDGAWKVFVPDPICLPNHLTIDLYRAQRRLEAWMEAADGAVENAGLVAVSCYDSSHYRTHIAKALGPADDIDTESAWRGDQSGAFRAAPSNSRLDHFRYGLGRQQIRLALDVRRAAARLEQWARRGGMSGLLLDLTAASRPECEASHLVEEGGLVLFEAMAAMSAGGSDSEPIMAALAEVGFFDAVRAAQTSDDVGAALGLLRDGEGADWVESLADADLKMAWKLSRKSSRLLATFLRGIIPPAIAGTVAFRSGVRSQTGLQGVPALVKAHFTKEMWGADLGAGTPEARWPTPAGEKYAGGESRAWNGSSAAGRVGPLEVHRVRVRGIQSGRQSAPGYDLWQEWDVYYVVEVTRAGVARTALNSLDGVMSVGNAALAGAALAEHLRSGGGLGFRDGVAAVKAISDLTSAMESLGMSTRAVGKLLVHAGPYAEMTLAVIDLAEAIRNRERRGLQEWAEPDKQSVVGAVCTVAGVALIIAAGTIAAVAAGTFGAAAASASAAAIAGAAAIKVTLIGIGTLATVFGNVVLWDARRKKPERERARDTLDEWIKASPWGDTGALQPGDIALALPGWQPGAGGARTDFEKITDEFVKAAYHFPSRLIVKEDELEIRVSPVYLPARGALLVSVNVPFQNIAGLNDTSEERFVLHYDRRKDDFRYAVTRPGIVSAPNPVAGAEEVRWVTAEDNLDPEASDAELVVRAGPGAVGVSLAVAASTDLSSVVDRMSRRAREGAASQSAPGTFGAVFDPVGADRTSGGAARTQATWLGSKDLVAALVAGPGAVTGAVFYRAMAPADLSVPDPADDLDAVAREPIEVER